MIRVRLFFNYDSSRSLEEEINSWLSSYTRIKIITVSLSVCPSPTSKTWYFACVTYSENE
jgi:hypothetical protein